MQSKTSGIILSTIKYSDSATIATVYTEQFGRISYMVYAINKKKSGSRAALLQPLTIVEMEVKHIPGKEIQQIKEMRIGHAFNSIPFSPIKNSIALFIAEILYKSLRQSEPDDNLYNFLENSILQLDMSQDGIHNFHLVFLQKLTRYLGFEPNEEVEGKYFDLINGVFLTEKPLHTHYLLPEVSLHFSALLATDYQNMDSLILHREERANLLKSMIDYYRLHVPEFHNLNSLEVLKSLFD